MFDRHVNGVAAHKRSLGTFVLNNNQIFCLNNTCYFKALSHLFDSENSLIWGQYISPIFQMKKFEDQKSCYLPKVS